MASKQGKMWTPDTLRIAMVGKTGAGKSSTGNTILGRKEFYAMVDGQSVTKYCSKADAEVDGRHVAVVDTPGLFDTTLSNKEIRLETYKSISLLAPGPHAFLLLIQIGRFTAEEKDAVEYIRDAFGKGADRYIMILFTRGDDLEFEGRSIDDYLRNTDVNLKQLVADCGHRFHVFNNRVKDRSQVTELLQKIDQMVLMNGGRCYTNKDLQEAEDAIQREAEKLMKEKEEQIRREEEKIRKKYQEETEKMLAKERQRQEKEKKQLEKKLGEMDLKIKQEQELREREKKEMEKEREREQKERERERAQLERERVQDRERERERERAREMERQAERERDRERRDQEREREHAREREREREQRQREDEIRREMDRRREAEVEESRRRHAEESRREAEKNNGFLRKAAAAVEKVVDAVEAVGEAAVSAGKALIDGVGSGVMNCVRWFRRR